MSPADRRWLEVRARSSAAGDAADLLAYLLVGLGARGVEEREGWYHAWFEEPEDPRAFVEDIRVTLASEPSLGSVHLEHGWQEHEEWAETWKRGLDARRLTTRIIVHPSWVEPRDVRKDDIVVVLDPGMAFGTAEHGTTRGCIRLLDGLVQPGDRLLDVGAGSGILAIVAARLGAHRIVAIEADPLACEAMTDNVAANGVADRVSIVEAYATSESLSGLGPVDGVIANIEAGLLEPMFDGFAEALPAKGWLLVSGILEEEWHGIRSSLERHGLVFERMDADGRWRSGLFRRG